MFAHHCSRGLLRRFDLHRAVVALGAATAFALAPIAAQAAGTNATGALSAGALSNTAPAITPFIATLTGANQTVSTAVGAWSVTDATGSSPGYTVSVSAGAPSVNGTSLAASLGSTWLTLTPTTAAAAPAQTSRWSSPATPRSALTATR
jgi:hypothetical protein